MKKVIKIGTIMSLVALMVTSIVIFSSFKKKSGASTVTITNKYWSNMLVQIRIGNNSVPENNPMSFEGNLSRGSSVTRSFDVLLWYRRSANPDNFDGRYTNWTQCFSSANIDNP